VAVLDVSMPILDGLEVLAQARTWPRSPAFVVLTMHDEYVHKALALGALGYLLKEDAALEIVDCVAAAAAGRRYLSRSLPARAEVDGPRAAALEKLTEAERRVLGLVGQHKTSREIAAILCVSHRTVQNHRASMCAKLELRGAQALLRFALDHREALRRL
jgi:DNA-binding NarL/FixJ family response regulator